MAALIEINTDGLTKSLLNIMDLRKKNSTSSSTTTLNIAWVMN